jgi:hypothetical protein
MINKKYDPIKPDCYRIFSDSFLPSRRRPRFWVSSLAPAHTIYHQWNAFFLSPPIPPTTPSTTNPRPDLLSLLPCHAGAPRGGGKPTPPRVDLSPARASSAARKKPAPMQGLFDTSREVFAASSPGFVPPPDALLSTLRCFILPRAY